MKFKDIFKFLYKKFTRKIFTPSTTGVGFDLRYRRGFTLIELMVVLFVSALISTVILANFGDFTSQTEFDNEALNIALTVREAQAYGIGSREISGKFGVAYGVIFKKSTPNSFTLDTFGTGSGGYYSQFDITPEKTIKIKDGFKISKLCLISQNSTYCNYLGVATVFKRPNPNANIYLLWSNGNFILVNFSGVKITLKRISDGTIKTINITNTGQIYVN